MQKRSVVVGVPERIGEPGFHSAHGRREVMLPGPRHRERRTSGAVEEFSPQLRMQPILTEPTQWSRALGPPPSTLVIVTEHCIDQGGYHPSRRAQTTHNLSAVVQ